MRTDTYTVFRRNDGYVNAIASSTPASGAKRLHGWTGITFEILLQTTVWREAADLIERERAA